MAEPEVLPESNMIGDIDMGSMTIMPEMVVVENTADQDFVAALGALEDLIRDKTANVPTKTGGSYSYSYADLGAALGHIRPILAEHGFAVVQPVSTNENGFVCVSTTLVHTSGVRFETEPLRMRQPDDPKLLGGTITYLRRYSLLASVGLATEDDDATAASKSTRKAAAKPAPEAPPEPVATTRMSRTSRPSGHAEPAGGQAEAERPLTGKMTEPQRRKMMAEFKDHAFVDSTDRHEFIRDVVGIDVASSADLTASQASQIIEALVALPPEPQLPDGTEF